MAYGAAGKPPKIPAKACLVFVMEIMKIKGETKPKALTFPEWSADELALWTEKDESACSSALHSGKVSAFGFVSPLIFMISITKTRHAFAGILGGLPAAPYAKFHGMSEPRR